MTATGTPIVTANEFGSSSDGASSHSSNNAIALIHEVLNTCQQQRREFEDDFGFAAILAVMHSKVPASAVESSIDIYRAVIRQNVWYFPNTECVLGDVPLFLPIWREVHTNYYKLATEIFDKIATDGLSALATPVLYAKVIQSETARGWVGKRSPIGPDKQIEKRAIRIESLISQHLSFGEIDFLLDIGGGLPGTSVLCSAEEDLISLLAEHSISGPRQPNTAIRTRLLREYSKYSITDLDSKVASYQKSQRNIVQRKTNKATELDTVLSRLPLPVRAEVTRLLDDIRILNFLNLNLEPRFSFKSWAGLMHGLVFAAVRGLPGMSHDVYFNLNILKEIQ